MNLRDSRSSPSPSPTPSPSTRPVKRPSLAPAQAVIDAAAAGLAVVLAYWLRFYAPGHAPALEHEPPDFAHYALAVPIVIATVPLAFASMGMYRNRRGRLFIDEFFHACGALAVAAVVILAMMGVAASGSAGFTYSRLSFIYWIAATLVVASLARYALRRWATTGRALSRFADRALVLGHGAAADLVITRARMFPDYGYVLAGVVSDVLPPGTDFHGVPVVGATSELRDLVLRDAISVVFVALADVSQDRVLHLMDGCIDTGVEFRIVPSLLEIMTTAVAGDQLDGIPLLQLRHGIEVAGPAATIKRLTDILVAGLGLVLLSPILGLIALLVRASSPGPIVIRQDRVGMSGGTFVMFKFRTMREDAEDDTGPIWARRGDPRRTAVGALLRRFSLDELPQLWNIFRGDMSMVGPRAERPVFVREFSARLPHYSDRHRVRPGLTGWAQANDLRGQTPVEERLIYDLYYIENWSLAFDLKIVLITLFRVFTHKNAY